jgi:hypothetical protein
MKKPECNITPNGTKRWYLNDVLHREDGPAVEYSDGYKKSWYINGLLHREDGPAVEYSDGTKYWYINGERHREDGPAVECDNGDKRWWLNHKFYTEEAYYKKLYEMGKISKEEYFLRVL